MTDIVVMALDQSPTASGWGVGTPGEKPTWGLFELKPWGDFEGKRLNAMYDWLMFMLNKHEVTDLFIEGGVDLRRFKFKSYETDEQQKMHKGSIAMAADRCGVRIQQVAIDSWRFRFLGTTKPPPGLAGEAARKWFKAEAMTRCAKDHNWFVDDHNVAEALGIWHYGCCVAAPNYAGKTDVLFRRAELRADVSRFRGEGG